MMQTWGHGGGFCAHAMVQIDADDSIGRERLFRYCARPIFASERLEWVNDGKQLHYRLSKPGPQGETVLTLRPAEFLDRVAALIQSIVSWITSVNPLHRQRPTQPAPRPSRQPRSINPFPTPGLNHRPPPSSNSTRPSAGNLSQPTTPVGRHGYPCVHHRKRGLSLPDRT